MAAFSKHIFKQYDIRGLVDLEITDDLAYKIGCAFADFISAELNSASDLSVVVGRDMRESSLSYQKQVMQGLTENGVQVLDIGLVSTPAFYFAVGHLKASGGIMVSASHNPAQYNGFKLTRAQAVPVSGETGIAQIAEIVERAGRAEKAEREGKIEIVQNIAKLAAQAEFAHAGNHSIKKFKIVADSANGMGAQYLDEFFKRIDADVTQMFWNFDGSFPNHEADPFKEENMKSLQEKVLEVGADLGIATDGDGDRIFFVDNKGRTVTPAVLRGLLAQIVLRDHPGATICYDIRPGKITRDMILQAGGVPCVTRVGHSLIKEKMKEMNAVFGGESSGHFFYAFPSGVYEGPVTVATQILQEMTRENKSLSQIVEPLERYVHSGEINFTVKDKERIIEKIKERYANGELSQLDGVTITFPDFWFNIRASNTEPKLRLNLEAINREIMEQRRDEIINLIKLCQ